MKCRMCGADIPSDAYFCSECGALTTKTQENLQEEKNNYINEEHEKNENPEENDLHENEYKICRACGYKASVDERFCMKCGTALDEQNADLRNKPEHTNKIWIIVLIAFCFMLLVATAFVTFVVVSSQQQNTAAPNNGSEVLNSAATAVPLEAPAPAPTPAEHTYQVVVSHITWNAAKVEAERMGGHLVTFNDEAEYLKIVGMLASYSSVKNVWIGACAPDGLTSAAAAGNYWNSGQAVWITGEPFTFAKWRKGEPSGYDAQLGTVERYIQIFCPKADGGVWTYNDAGDDLSEYKSGTLAYVVEFE